MEENHTLFKMEEKSFYLLIKYEYEESIKQNKNIYGLISNIKKELSNISDLDKNQILNLFNLVEFARDIILTSYNDKCQAENLLESP